MNFTLNVTASTELLNALNRISGVMESLLVSPPKTVIVDVITDTSNSNSIHNQMQVAPVQQTLQNQQAITYKAQEPVVQQIIPTQQPVQNQAPGNAATMINQPAAAPVIQVQAPLQTPNQTLPLQAPGVPTVAQTYIMEQLAVAATQLVDAGRRTELVNLLQSFGVQALTALPKEQYGAFATQLRALGAKI